MKRHLIPLILFPLILIVFNAHSQTDNTTATPTINEFQKLLASDGAAEDEFGITVAIDGDRAIIGAIYADHNDNNSGTAYIFERNADGTWNTNETQSSAALFLHCHSYNIDLNKLFEQ